MVNRKVSHARDEQYERALAKVGLARRPTALLYAHAGIRHAAIEYAFGGSRNKHGDKQSNGKQLRTFKRKAARKENSAAVVKDMAHRYAQKLRARDALGPYPDTPIAMREYILSYFERFKHGCHVRGLVRWYVEEYVQGFYAGLCDPLAPEAFEIDAQWPDAVDVTRRRSTRQPCIRCGTRSGMIQLSSGGKWLCADVDACERRADLHHYRKPKGGAITVPQASVKVEYEEVYQKPQYDLSTRAGWRVAVGLGDKTVQQFEQWLDAQ